MKLIRQQEEKATHTEPSKEANNMKGEKKRGKRAIIHTRTHYAMPYLAAEHNSLSLT